MEMSGEGKNSEAGRDVIVLFTSNFAGGILQFTMQLGSSLSSLGYKTVGYIPDNAKVSGTNDPAMNMVKFRKEKALSLKSKSSKSIAKEIEKLDPALVLFADTAIVSSQVLLSMKENTRTAMFIHDVVPHPGHYSLYESIKIALETRGLRYAVKKSDKVILLSENSYNQFKAVFPRYPNRAVMMPLGAHVPEADQSQPPELNNLNTGSYYLFFGRIGKYKGIINLLKAYIAITGQKPLLIIAGSGELQPEEKDLIANNNGVVLINRYIEDGEMLYLINNALTVVLPYIEASQSGVLPIAYQFKVPVITSNVAGLVEFVENGVTGIICNDNEEMTNALIRICDQDYRNQLGFGAYKFYQDRLNWSGNLMRCIEPLIRK